MEASAPSEMPNTKHWQVPTCQDHAIRLWSSTVEKSEVCSKGGEMHSKLGRFVFALLTSAKGGRSPLEDSG